jgi:HEXXH motif-containing protein
MEEKLKDFLNAPFPLWETNLTRCLVGSKFAELSLLGINTNANYNTLTVLKPFSTIEHLNNKSLLLGESNGSIYLEKPDFENLYYFYSEQGLQPLEESKLNEQKAARKLKSALKLFATIPECLSFLTSIVNCIQVINTDGPEFDKSYSHPNIPFTVFLSVCEDDSNLSNIRVAEGILHEAMHLKLTLIQNIIQLVEPGTNDTFYSPWRETHRPLMGVLHGLFVFRAIKDFFLILKEEEGLDNRTFNALTYRISDIDRDFQALRSFSLCKGLTKAGANFAAKLLQC